MDFSDDFLNDMKDWEGSIEVQSSNWAKEQYGYKTFSGGKFMPYKEGDNWTIGYGTRIDDNEIDRFQSGITTEEADSLLNDKLREAYNYAPSIIDDFESRPNEIKEVVTDLIYNMGYGTLSKEFDGFVGAMNDYNYPKAMAELKYINPDDLGVKTDHRDDTGDAHNDYYKTRQERGDWNLDKIQGVYRESLNTETDDGVFNVIKDQDEYE